jgi:uncharacterized membrane protein
LFIRTETQHLTVHLLNGPHKGEEMAISNTLTGKLEFDEFYATGDTILVEYDAKDGRPDHGTRPGPLPAAAPGRSSPCSAPF